MPDLEKELKALKLREDWEFNHSAAPKYGPYIAPPIPLALSSTRDLHTALRNASKSIPRFLFCAWSAHSRGNPKLNSVDVITPLAFLNGNTAATNIFDIESFHLQARIRGLYLGGQWVETPFSSWPHSLPFVLSMLDSEDHAHVSVIDTHRLKPENFIFHCGTFDLAAFGIPLYGEEFLVYGVVSGDAHRAVPRKAITKHIVTMTLRYDFEDFDDFDDYNAYYGLPPTDSAKGKKV